MKNTDKFIEETVKFLMGAKDDEIVKKLGIKGIKSLIEEAYIKGQIDTMKKYKRLKVKKHL